MLLISHQHCLLALATAIDQYKLLDISVDDFPGDSPDKCARCLKLHHLPGMRDMAGGKAREVIAAKVNGMVEPIPMRTCT